VIVFKNLDRLEQINILYDKRSKELIKFLKEEIVE